MEGRGESGLYWQKWQREEEREQGGGEQGPPLKGNIVNVHSRDC